MKTLTRARLLPALGVIAASSLVLSACGYGDDADPADTATSSMTVTSTAASSPATTTQTPTTTAAPATARSMVRSTDRSPDRTTNRTTARSTNRDVPPLGTASLDDRQRPAEGAYDLLVTNVRVGGHQTFDRVVFDMSGSGTPGYFIRYTTEPTQQASGQPIDYEGVVALQVSIEGTPYPTEEDAQLMEQGTTEGVGIVNEVTYSSLFEARTEFVIGLDEKVPYSVTYLQNPSRLVIDFVTG